MKNMMINNGLMCKLPAINDNEIHNRNNKNAIVMYSGGLDSTVALYWALENYKNIKVLIIDYNQPHSIEIDFAIAFLKKLNINYRIINLTLPNDFWGIENHLTRGQACLMTSIAALDIGHEGADIIHGILKTDNYGDCDRKFLDSFADVLFHPNDLGKIGIATPLRAFDGKEDVIAMAYTYGIPISKTWTCRDPYKGKACEKCVQCKLKKKALESFFENYKVDRCSFYAWQDIEGSPYHPMVCDKEKYSYIIEMLVNANAFQFAKPCVKYWAPDNSERVDTKNVHIHSKYLKKKTMNCLSAHGYFEDNYRWEICVFEDGTVAATKRVPDMNMIEEAIIKEIIG